ncbi:MAG: hypothetical protein ABJJ53_19110 [Sulfitobacter sp.]
MDRLKMVMRLNAVSCVSFGLLFIVLPQAVAGFLGDVPRAVILFLGLGLLGNGGHLSVASSRAGILKAEVIWFSLGDFLWWLASFGLIAAHIWITTPWGIFATVVVAVMVGALGVVQLWILGLRAHGNTVKEHFSAIGASWMALPLWVMVWLVMLNATFLAAFAFLPDRIGEVTLLAYVATAPLLAGQVGHDAGLRRILGLAHLVPWVPLLIWLVLVPPATPYTLLLTGVLAICLAFDVNDLRLFLKGDRKVLGAGA